MRVRIMSIDVSIKPWAISFHKFSYNCEKTETAQYLIPFLSNESSRKRRSICQPWAVGVSTVHSAASLEPVGFRFWFNDAIFRLQLIFSSTAFPLNALSLKRSSDYCYLPYLIRWKLIDENQKLTFSQDLRSERIQIRMTAQRRK